MSKEYLLVGGGLASHEAAKAIRAADEEAIITMICEERELPYNRPPLSKAFLSGKLGRDRLFFPRNDEYERLNIRTELGRTITRLNLDRHVARADNGLEFHFDKVLLATGGRPRVPPIPGGDDPRLHVLRTLADAERIATAAAAAEHVVVIGGGFIGLETASTLRAQGLEVTVIEREQRVWARVATEAMSAMIRQRCEAEGMKLLMDQAVTSIQVGKPCTVTTDRAEVSGDLVVIGIGIQPNIELALDACVDVEGGILVDETMRTSHEDVYAAGDVCCYPDAYLGGLRRVEHWGHAKASGACAGKNMAGQHTVYDHLSYVWSEVFGLRVNAAGLLPFGCQVIVRGDYADGAVGEFFVRDNQLVGGMLVGMPPRLFQTLKKLLEARASVAGREADLHDPENDLTSWL